MELTEAEHGQAVDKLRVAQKLKEKNLHFFKDFHPSIYTQFGEFRLDQYKVSYNSDVNALDVLLNGRSIYNNRPVAEAKEMLADFEGKLGQGKTLRTVQPPFGGYDYPRYFHRQCNKILSNSPVTIENYSGYTIPDFYPLIIFNGVGAGYHVEMFFQKYSAINALIVEPSSELFACSLYIVDWEEICRPFIDNPERNIHFIIGPIQDELHLYGYIMKYVASHCPIFPLTCLFINHKGLDLYTRITKKINDDTHAFVSTWGFYDDEINQINNCLHNINLDIPIIKPSKKEFMDIPVFIVGAGPSLDDKIELIKQHKNDALIISCGTAIHILHKNGIKPDIQFELESHQVTLKSLEAIEDKDWIKSIPVMGPAQLSPKLYKFFNKKVIYFKGESVTSMLFGKDDTSVRRGTPTCTNGAMAIFSHWGFKNIYFLGMDFGYRDLKIHHANGSIYYNTKDEDLIKGSSVIQDATLSVEAVDGTTIKTKPILYTAKRTIEMTAKAFSKTSTYYNCSNGAKMDNTIWIKDSNLDIKESNNYKQLKSDFLDLQYKNQFTIDKNIIKERLNILNHNMKELNEFIKSELDKIDGSLYSLTAQINIISSFMDKKIKPELPPFYFFLRGTIWHLFYIGYSHALCIKDTKDLKKWINTWKNETINTLIGVNNHFCKIVYKKYDYDLDPWTQRSTSDPED